MALAASFAAYATPFTIRAGEWFIAFSMCILAMLKLQNVDKFATMFLNYDLLAQRWVRVTLTGDFGGAYGAARLGQMAATGGGAELAAPPAIAATIDPVAALTDAFDAGHARYRAAQAALKDLT